MTAEHPIVAFLRARYDEDERTARESRNTEPSPGDHELYVLDDDHRHDTIVISGSRVLREVTAKRRIVATYTELDAHPNRLSYAFIQQQWVALRAVIAALALPYAECEGYQEEWKL